MILGVNALTATFLTMFELNATDKSLLSWVHQVGVPVESLSLQFNQGNLIVQCQSIEDATRLWEQRSLLHLPGKELCFRVNGTFYVGATLR